MAWTIALEREDGAEITRLTDPFDSRVLFRSDVGELKLLQYLDPYGDLVLNHLQVPDLISDLERLLKFDPTNTTISPIIDLARKCQQEHHSYIKFYGD
jgi:hypothetical protein